MATEQFKNITGGAELQAFLDQLPAKVEANIMRSAMRQGVNVLRDEIKANVPVLHGDLRDSIKVGTSSRKGVVKATVRIGNRKAWYARLIEFTGAAAHSISAKGKGMLSFGGFFSKSAQHPGMKAKPFVRPALDSRANAAIQAVGDQVRKRLTKEGLNNAPTIEVDDR